MDGVSSNRTVNNGPSISAFSLPSTLNWIDRGLFVQQLKGDMSWVEIVKDRLHSICY